MGLGDGDHEHVLLPALMEAGHAVVWRCLSADDLMAATRQPGVQLVLASTDLHRLTSTALDELLGRGIPTVLLAGYQPTLPRAQRVAVLPASSDAATILTAIDELLGGVVASPIPTTFPGVGESQAFEDEALPTPASDEAVSSGIIAITSGHGSPGRTTLAINLAAGLGATSPTLLLDADLPGPSVAASLDADPTRNVYMVAHSQPETGADWTRAFEQECQPLGRRSPKASVLCGIPKPELAGQMSARFIERLLTELERRYRYVIVDLGAAPGAPAATQRTILRRAGQVLFVTAADIVGLWHTRSALASWKQEGGLNGQPAALVINRFNPRWHHKRSEIEWALRQPLAAIIPEDRAQVERAVAAQQPLVFQSHGQAARELLTLAGRIQGGEVVLAPEPEPRPAWWKRSGQRLATVWPRGRAVEQAEVVADGARIPIGG